jgi:flavin-dependent dehydrogenase
MPDGVAALSRLGVEIGSRESYRFRGIRFLGDEMAVEADFPSGFGLGIRRTVLHRILMEHAERAGVSMLWGGHVKGIGPMGVILEDQAIPCRWIVGADGENSLARRWASLETYSRERRRFGFRRHYGVAPWTGHMELYWGAGNQVFVTPVGAEEVCVAAISKDSHLRLDETLLQFPELARRLHDAPCTTTERGAVSATRKLKSVYRGRIALVGDASGSVDAITGEGLCLAFQQAEVLADALEACDLETYQAEHRRIARRPQFMAALMLTMCGRTFLRRRALRAFASKPAALSKMLAMHVGNLSALDAVTAGVSLGWQMLTK